MSEGIKEGPFGISEDQESILRIVEKLKRRFVVDEAQTISMKANPPSLCLLVNALDLFLVRISGCNAERLHLLEPLRNKGLAGLDILRVPFVSAGAPWPDKM